MIIRSDIPVIDIYQSQFHLFNRGNHIVVTVPVEKEVEIGHWMKYRFGNIEGFAEAVDVRKSRCTIRKVS